VANSDKEVLRELGRRKREIGELPVQQETTELWRKLNGLEDVRPLVWMTELPWHEITAKAPELQARCEDEFLASVEWHMRAELYQWDHFACDMVVEPVVYSSIVGGPVGVYAYYGIEEKTVSRAGAKDVQFEPVIHTMEDAEQIETPPVWFDEEKTQQQLELLQGIFDGVIPVERRGIVHQWHTPWDQAVRWYGIERLMFDMIDKPELVARVCEKICLATGEVLDRQQELGMLATSNGNHRVGSGGMGICDDLPSDTNGRPATPADQWGCGNAQIFSEVSPAMHEEFSLQFERPVMERFGLTYYGCCEPLHNKVDMLRSVSNLRKISISPRADLAVAAEAIDRDYAISFKPNPAFVAPDVFRREHVEADLREALAALNGCCVEVILKDVTTVRDDLVRLDGWADTAMAVVRNL